MAWQVGQRVVCDRLNRRLTDCAVLSVSEGSVTISCPSESFVICGRQACLEKLGWRLAGPGELGFRSILSEQFKLTLAAPRRE